MRKILFSFIILAYGIISFAQETGDSVEYKMLDYKRVREYEIADIKVTGVKYLQPAHLVTISGLHKGKKIKIPGQDISLAINKYWRHGLFSDVKIILSKIEGDQVWIEINLTEQPRLNSLEILGVNKTERGDIEEKVEVRRGTQITENLLNNASLVIKKHFSEKGFYNVDVSMKQRVDTSNQSMVDLIIRVDKNQRVKIQEIVFEGNEAFPDSKLRSTMKKTRQRDINIFKGSKFLEDEYKADKLKLIEFYNKSGYRDAKILNEEIVKLNDKRIGLNITLHEGNPYYIKSISWIGNTKYPMEYLNLVLGIKAGDLYDQTHLQNRLSNDEDAITSMYMDNGYLFFNINPVEASIDNDSVNLELRVYEGKPATLNQIRISGNTKTNEHVIRRELYTRPGELFSRSDIIRSVRELATLGHFNPETIAPNPLPNPAEGTVDIEYGLEERANDQLELSGGWGGYYGFMGTVGIRFSNFSIRNFFDPTAWRPVPSGDGQTLQLRVQATGKAYQSYNISFIEPWFGGKKPNSFSTSFFYSQQRPNTGSAYNTTNPTYKTYGASVGLGKRLKWPDDFFSIYAELSYRQYKLHNYTPFYILQNGNYNLLSLRLSLSRSSQDQMIYPRRGSAFTVGVQLTPPYSLFNDKDYSDLTNQEKYKNIEFHKWTFSAANYTNLIGKFVLAIKAEFGYLGAYNETIGPPPFEKFEVGGSGLSGYDLYGTDVVALRGYEDESLSRKELVGDGSAYTTNNTNIYTRYYAELRYPFSLNPSATIYGLVFAEAGNGWGYMSDFNPFAVKRAAGVGIRAFLPMFGLLGVDWGYGFDPDNVYPNGGASGPQWHFVLGQQF